MDEVIPPNVHRFGQKNHRKPEPGAYARRGGMHAVRRKPLSAPGIVRRGNPLQPTPAGDGLRPAGAREWEHPPAVGPGGNASLAAIVEDSLQLCYPISGLFKNVRPTIEVSPQIRALLSPSPRGEGGPLRGG